jgi:hypothetical protein
VSSFLLSSSHRSSLATRHPSIDDLATMGEMHGIFSMTSLLKSLKLDIILESFVIDTP